MVKIELVRTEMMAALKARDTKRKDALSLLLSALKSKAIDKRQDLTEDEENAVVYKEIKDTQESMETAPPDRVDVIEECKYKIKVYSEFAPERMGEEEIKAALQSVIAELGLEKLAPPDKGKIMKLLMPALKGKAEGGLINKLVDERVRAGQ